MAVVMLKTFLFPRRRSESGGGGGGETQRLLLVDDVERQSPSSSGGGGGSSSSARSRSFDDDKPAATTTTTAGRESTGSGTLSRCRIDPRIISDATIGLSDGLTVPFALTAGLSALGTTELVVYAGLAELVAGAISMGLGGYLGAKGEADGYAAALEETRDCVAKDPEGAAGLLRSTFERYGFARETLDAMTDTLLAEPEQLVNFLMRFHHQLAEADFAPSRAYISGVTIATGYFMGGLVPLSPYLFFEHVREALYCSILVMAIALFVFGWTKTSLVGECSRWVCFQNAIQMLVLGGLAAGAAMGCVKAIGG